MAASIDMSRYEKYDAALLGILQHEGRITNFLEAMFGFLYRRTDFYIEMTSKTDKMGFPPGIAFKQVEKAFEMFQNLHKENVKRKHNQIQQSQQEKDKKPIKNEKLSQVVKSSKEPQRTIQNSVPTIKDSNCQSTAPKTPGDGSSNVDGRVPPASQSEQTQQKIPSSVNSKPEASAGDGENEDEDSEQSRLQKIFQSNPDSYNGAIRDKYAWSQSITDVDVHIIIPRSISKGKDVKVFIGRKQLKAEYKNKDGHWVTIVDGALTWDVNKEDSMWSLVPGEHIHVNLEKVQERWWESVLEDEPKINVRKIDASRPMSDLDDESQAKIEEMMYNERQKRLGLPQSHEKKVHDILKQAWDADGSPFKGQEFDPSKFNVSQDNMMNPL